MIATTVKPMKIISLIVSAYSVPVLTRLNIFCELPHWISMETFQSQIFLSPLDRRKLLKLRNFLVQASIIGKSGTRVWRRYNSLWFHQVLGAPGPGLCFKPQLERYLRAVRAKVLPPGGRRKAHLQHVLLEENGESPSWSSSMCTLENAFESCRRYMKTVWIPSSVTVSFRISRA